VAEDGASPGLGEAARGTYQHGVHIDDPTARRVIRRRRWLHRITIGTLMAILGLAVLDGVDLIDAYGVDTEVITAEASGVHLAVTYPTVARPALAAPFRIEVSREGGFDDSVLVAVKRSYLELWDLNGIVPAPAGETNDGDWVVWEFDPPEGDALRVTYEARIEPGVQAPREGSVAFVSDGERAPRVDFTTAVRP
jgi:hypothetical protein